MVLLKSLQQKVTQCAHFSFGGESISTDVGHVDTTLEINGSVLHGLHVSCKYSIIRTEIMDSAELKSVQARSQGRWVGRHPLATGEKKKYNPYSSGH